MSIEELREEHERSGRLSDGSMDVLRGLLASDDPYGGITLVGDLRLAELASDVQRCLRSADPMVRWNAVCVLTTRMRLSESADEVLGLATSDEDEVVRAAALVGIGAISRLVPRDLRRRIAGHLAKVLEDDTELTEMRGAAYEGMLEALEVPQQERPSAARLIDVNREVKEEIVEQFKKVIGDDERLA